MSTTGLTREQIATQFPPTPKTQGMWKLAGSAFLNILLNPFNLGFSIALPIFMYLMFGVGQPYSALSVGNGNAAAQVLVSMGLFGVLLATASFGAAIALERVQGISRAYALTPLGAGPQIISRLVANLCVSAVLVTFTFVVGACTGAKMAFWTWVASALVITTMSLLSSAIGFACGFAIRSDSAFAACSGVLVLSAFGAGMTVPIEQMGEVIQSISPWTPLWGAVRLSLLPLYGWEELSVGMIMSVVVWTGFFGLLAMWGLRRDTKR